MLPVPVIQFPFSERKAAQAAWWLADRSGGSIEYMKLIKLLYMADRFALVDTGAPVTGDAMVSMDHGPVLSEILDIINYGKRPGSNLNSAWFEYLSPPADYRVHTRNPVPLPRGVGADAPARARLDELADCDIDALVNSFERFGRVNQWDLVDHLHENLPEWQDPAGSMIPIDPAVVLRVEGFSEDRVREVAKQAAAARRARQRERAAR